MTGHLGGDTQKAKISLTKGPSKPFIPTYGQAGHLGGVGSFGGGGFERILGIGRNCGNAVGAHLSVLFVRCWIVVFCWMNREFNFDFPPNPKL